MEKRDELAKQVFERVVAQMQLEKIVATMSPEKLSFDIPLMKSQDPSGLALDSLDILELVVVLERDFQLNVPDEDMERLDTINHIAEYIMEKRGE